MLCSHLPLKPSLSWSFQKGFNIYRPQRSWGKVIFSQASVILSTGGEYLDRYTPRDQLHPPRTRYTHPLGPGTPPQDQLHIPPPRPATPPLAAVHAGRYGQQAGGTHPTGMHSCFVLVHSYRFRASKHRVMTFKVCSHMTIYHRHRIHISVPWPRLCTPDKTL